MKSREELGAFQHERESCPLSRGEVSFVHSFRKAGVTLLPIPSSGLQNNPLFPLTAKQFPSLVVRPLLSCSICSSLHNYCRPDSIGVFSVFQFCLSFCLSSCASPDRNQSGKHRKPPCPLCPSHICSLNSPLPMSFLPWGEPENKTRSGPVI